MPPALLTEHHPPVLQVVSLEHEPHEVTVHQDEEKMANYVVIEIIVALEMDLDEIDTMTEMVTDDEMVVVTDEEAMVVDLLVPAIAVMVVDQDAAKILVETFSMEHEVITAAMAVETDVVVHEVAITVAVKINATVVEHSTLTEITLMTVVTNNVVLGSTRKVKTRKAVLVVKSTFNHRTSSLPLLTKVATLQIESSIIDQQLCALFSTLQ